MNRFLLVGLIFALASAVLVLFESIGAMMTAGEVVFKSSSLVDFFGDQAFMWIDRIPAYFVQSLLNSLVALPAWIILAGLAVISFVIGGITSR